MKKSYFFAALLIIAFAVNLSAQYDFIELDGKDPAFWIKFDKLVGEKLNVEGTQFNNWKKLDGTWATDTVLGHAWGGSGSFEDFTKLDQVVSSENFSELFLPTIFWDSYVSLPGRAQGIAAYASEGYGGPRDSSARTVCFYVNVSDSARSDGGGGGAWDSPYFYGLGNWQVEGARIYWYIDPVTMKFTLFFGGESRSITAENVIPKNKWVHLALTIPEGGARAGIKLWVNGTVIPFAEETGPMKTLNTTLEAAWDGVRIGALVNLWMADYRIYDSELTQFDIKRLLGLNTSVQELGQKNLFNFYPVPNDGIFTLEIADAGKSRIIISNTLGQVVHDQFVDKKEIINVSNLPSGMYFISLSDNKNNLQTRKFLIK